MERAHKSKNADKTRSDKLYEQAVRIYEKEKRKVSALIPEEAVRQTAQSSVPGI